MKSRIILILIAAIFASAAVGLFVYIKNKQPHSPTQKEEAQKADVKGEDSMIMVAKTNLAPGTLVKVADFDFVSWNSDLINPSYFRKSDKDKLSVFEKGGVIVLYQVLKGEPLKHEDLIYIGDKSLLSGLISGGKKAVTIPLSKVSNANSLYAPGDLIDIILAKKSRGRDDDSSNAKTVLRNLKIIAVDESFARAEGAQAAAKVPKMITVEVSSSQAEELAESIVDGSIVISQASALTPADERNVVDDIPENQNIEVFRGGSNANRNIP